MQSAYASTDALPLGCNLLGTQGIIVQAMLAMTAFSILVFKRLVEVPPRPIKIWFLDVSKQILSQMITHLGNVLFSILVSEKVSAQPEAGVPDQCNFYFATILIDTTIGVYLACSILQRIEIIFEANGLEKLKSGNYYVTHIHESQSQLLQIIEVHYCIWFAQVAIWLTIVLCVKAFVFSIQYLLFRQLGQLSFYVLYFLNAYPLVKLVFVMMIVPTIMNMLLFWIQDNFLRKKNFSEDNFETDSQQQSLSELPTAQPGDKTSILTAPKVFSTQKMSKNDALKELNVALN